MDLWALHQSRKYFMDRVRELTSNIALNTYISPLNMIVASALLVWRPSRATLCPFTVHKTKAGNDLNSLTFGNSLLLSLLACYFTTASRRFVFLTSHLPSSFLFCSVISTGKKKCKFSSEEQMKAWKTLVINVAYQAVSVGGENSWVIYIKSKEIES